MVQTKAGAAKARAALIKKYGSLEAYKEHFREIGRAGGRNGKGTLKGFAANHELASKYGRIGGLKSRRKKNVR